MPGSEEKHFSITTIVVSLIGLCGTITIGMFGFAQFWLPYQENVRSTQTAEILTQVASLVQSQLTTEMVITSPVPPTDAIASPPTEAPAPSFTATNTPTPLDLYASAVSAEWVSGAGKLPFGGPDAANGFATSLDGARLEDGTFPSKLLVMHPNWVTDGEISGVYLPYLVAHKGHFRAQLGFLAMPDGTCGVGNVKFRFSYKEPGSSERPLGEWTETCDGMLRSIDIDLNSIEGKTVQFILAVLANDSFVHDWAVWVNPHIEY